MSQAPPAQTPVLFTLAGGSDLMSAECEKTVEKAGYPSDCFGSYDEVKAKIDAAKQKCADYDAKKPGAPAPSPRDRFLANCQSGHLAQNAIFQQPGQRGNSCQNIQPGGNGYHTRLAPCMPMPGPSGAPGTPHTLVTQGENDHTRCLGAGQPRPTPPAFIPMSADQVSAGAQDSARTAARAGLGSSGRTSPETNLRRAEEMRQERRGLRQQHALAPKRSDERRDLRNRMDAVKAKEGPRRAQAAAGLQQQSAKGATGKDPAKPRDQKAIDQLVEEVAKCIEQFRQKAMDSMRMTIKQDYSPPKLAETRKNRQDAQAAAEGRYQSALQRARANPDDLAARQELRSAAQERKAANMELTNVDCLAAQASQIPSGPPMPPMSGRVPVRQPVAPRPTSPRRTGQDAAE